MHHRFPATTAAPCAAVAASAEPAITTRTWPAGATGSCLHSSHPLRAERTNSTPARYHFGHRRRTAPVSRRSPAYRTVCERVLSAASAARENRRSERLFRQLARVLHFLTRPDPASMVRAASRAATAAISPYCLRVSKAWPTTRATKDDRKHPPTDEAALSARFQRLGERLGTSTSSTPPAVSSGASSDHPIRRQSLAASGFRPSWLQACWSAAGIGWLLDWWLGISPWGLIVFVLLGFAAGMLNVMRSAGLVDQIAGPERFEMTLAASATDRTTN